MQKLMRKLHKSEKGFTLIELMVVVVIIGVLVAIAIPIYSGIQLRAAQSAHDANARTLQGAASVYYAEVGAADILSEHEDAAWDTNTPADALILVDDGGTPQAEFGNYIDGGMPELPDLLTFPDNPTGYTVVITQAGQVTVTPAIGAYTD